MTFQSNYSDSFGDSAQGQQCPKHQGYSILADESNISLQMNPMLSDRSQFQSDSSAVLNLICQRTQHALQQEVQPNPAMAEAISSGNNVLNKNTSKANPATGLLNLVSLATASLNPNAFNTSSLSTETTSISSCTSADALQGNMMDSNSRFITQAYLEIMVKRSFEEAQAAAQQHDKQLFVGSAMPSQPAVATETRKRIRDEAMIHQIQTPVKKRATEQSNIDSSVCLPRQATYDQKWNQHYQELVAFKGKHGHCRVPQKCEPKESLSQWVKRQRYHRKHKPGIISEDRIRKLDEIGFVWDAQGLVWQTRFEELLEFKRNHDHCSVPYKYSHNQKLATWVKCQRRQYQMLQQGKQSHLTLERVKLLGDAGFVWNPRGGSGSGDE
eukprot:scaffold1192_cov58-Cylindrotheca_fusiformis.AAC.7